jgi:hypothetical protein
MPKRAHKTATAEQCPEIDIHLANKFAHFVGVHHSAEWIGTPVPKSARTYPLRSCVGIISATAVRSRPQNTDVRNLRAVHNAVQIDGDRDSCDNINPPIFTSGDLITFFKAKPRRRRGSRARKQSSSAALSETGDPRTLVRIRPPCLHLMSRNSERFGHPWLDAASNGAKTRLVPSPLNGRKRRLVNVSVCPIGPRDRGAGCVEILLDERLRTLQLNQHAMHISRRL